MIQAKSLKGEDGINIYVPMKQPGYVEVSLFDKVGDLCYNYSCFSRHSTYKHHIPYAKLTGKVYLLRVALNGNTLLQDVIEL